ncbi:MAG TPA: nucleoside hydrolase [Chloroflexota bacterium]|nr:nucleoside hydrolase [Chloroflexota bacterium]
MTAPAAPVPLILDTDIGDDVDDVFALLLAARRPEVRLVGVTTVFGQVDERARLARLMLELAGREDVPVAAGSRETLGGRDPTGEGGATMASARGMVGQAGSELWERLGRGLERRGAVDLIVETVRSSGEPVTLVAIGPLTNVAAALHRAPDLAGRVQEIVLMGGRLGEEAPKGEHNFNCDPEATRIVLESGARLKIGTYEVTRRAQLRREHVAALRAGDAASRAAGEQLNAYLDHCRRDWTSMYDPLSLTLAYTDRYLPTRGAALRVETSERQVLLSEEPGAAPTADVSAALDADGFVEHLLTTIAGAGDVRGASTRGASASP